MSEEDAVGQLLIPTVLNFLAGAGLYFAFRSRPSWRRSRPVRALALSTIFVSLTIYAAFAIDGNSTLTATAACVMIVVGGYLPVVGHLLTHELPSAASEPDTGLALAWRVRRSLLFGGDGRRRRLWERKRRQLAKRSTDPLLRLELLELSLGLGEYEEALFHAHALDELLPTGETHAYALHRLAHILAERQLRLADAQPTLHRLVRLYPASSLRTDADRLIRLFQRAHG
jgi:hypothetical protein